MIRSLLVLLALLLAVFPHQSQPSPLDSHPEPSAISIVRGPYLQLGTPESVVVRWRTDQASDSWVVFGDSPTDLVNSIADSTLSTEHEVLVSGLTPDTTYFYAVGTGTQHLAGGDSSFFFTTPPPPGTDKATRIWVLGDQGRTSDPALQIRDVYHAWTDDRATDLWLMLGDNAYSSGTDSEYQSAVFEKHSDLLRRSVLWPAFGNHDGISANGTTQTGPYFDMFTLSADGEAGGVASGSEAYYSFDYGNIHFVVLDSEDAIVDNLTTMLNWLTADLEDTRAGWSIALWHHAPYSKGSHDSDSENRMVQMRNRVVPILEAYGVDLVLAGHSHAYERSYLLDGHYGMSSTLTAGMILDRGDGRLGSDGAYTKLPGPHHGTVYVTAGSSANLSGGSLDHPAMAVSLLSFGSLVVNVAGDWLTTKLLDERGEVVDSFTIYKPGADPASPVTGHPRYFPLILNSTN